jgi:hypothetical protein
MNLTNNDSLQYQNVKNIELKNKGFLILDSIFKKNNWDLVKNEMDWISYSRFGEETTSFDIKIFTNKIVVSVPIKNSIYQYVTSFNSYYEASEYIEQRFNDYIM